MKATYILLSLLFLTIFTVYATTSPRVSYDITVHHSPPPSISLITTPPPTIAAGTKDTELYMVTTSENIIGGLSVWIRNATTINCDSSLFHNPSTAFILNINGTVIPNPSPDGCQLEYPPSEFTPLRNGSVFSVTVSYEFEINDQTVYTIQAFLQSR